MKIARKSYWKTEPLPARHAVIPLDRRFTLPEMEIIRRGLIPDQMEDKWFIYWEDDQLWFHRSWTGLCMFVVRFRVDDGGGTMVEARANRDREQYFATDDDHDRALISYLIDGLLLDRDVPFPSAETSVERRAIETWSAVGRAGFRGDPSLS